MLKTLLRQFRAHRIGSWLALASGLLVFANTAEAQTLDAKAYFDRAKARRERKDYLGAILDATEVLARQPKNAEAYFERALAKDLFLLPVYAIGDLDRAIDLDPKMTAAYENRERIRYASSIGNWSLIPKDIEESRKLGGNNLLTLRHRATYRSMVGDVEGAIADLDACLKADPKDRFYFYSFRGQTRLRYGDASGAIEDLNRDVANPPPLNITWLHRGLAHLVLGDKTKADADFAQYLLVDKNGQGSINEYREIGRILTENATPQSAADFVKRADLLYAKNWKSNAIADCTRATAFDEAHVPAYILKGRCLKDLACYEEAIETFSKAIKLEPANPEHLYWRAVSAWNADKNELAITDCDAILAIDNRHLNGLNIKALALYAQEKFDDAIQLHVTASEINPSDSAIWANLADDYVRAGEYAKCIEACNKSLELAPNTTRVLELRAKAWWGLGDIKEAHADFARWVQVNPRDTSAYYSRARFEIMTKQNDDARADLERARGIDRYNAEYPRLTALLKEAAGDSAAALKEANQAVMLNSGHSINFTTRGALLLKAGKSEEAERDFELAVKTYPLFKNQLPGIKEAVTSRGVIAALLELPKAKGGRPNVTTSVATTTPTVNPTPPVSSTPPNTTSTTPAAAPVKLPPAIKKIFDDGVKSYESGEYEKAATSFKRVTTLFPRYAEPYLYRGLINQRAGKKEDAERDFAAALRIDPSLKSRIEQEQAKIK